MGETQSPPKKLRSRQCMFVLYPESQETAIKYAQENFPCAWALHDKDVHTEKAYQAYIEKNGEPPEWRPGDLKKPHIHFVCSFPNARYFSGIARDLGVPVNTIRKVNNLYKAYVYLWHMLDPDKYQYSKDIVGSHEFEEPSEHAGMTQMEDDQVQILLDMPPLLVGQGPYIVPLTVVFGQATESQIWKFLLQMHLEPYSLATILPIAM